MNETTTKQIIITAIVAIGSALGGLAGTSVGNRSNVTETEVKQVVERARGVTVAEMRIAISDALRVSDAVLEEKVKAAKEREDRQSKTLDEIKREMGSIDSRLRRIERNSRRLNDD